MRIVVLGQVGVVADDWHYTVPRAQARGVLALLSLHAGRPMSHDAITEALWAGQTPNSGRAQIYGAICAIRQLGANLGAPDMILSGRYGYQLVIASEQVDVGRFQQLASQARHARDAGDHPEAIRLLHSALRLWEGEPLADAAGAFVPSVRADLAERRLRAIGDLADSQIRLGHYVEAIEDLQPLVAAFPLREGLRAMLMLALHRCGRQAEALGLYRSYRQLLADQEGLDPGAELATMHRAILRGSPHLRGADPQVPAPPAAPAVAVIDQSTAALTPQIAITPAMLPADIASFVGRDEALARLDALIEGDAVASRLVLIDGSPGVGKTALAMHWGHRVRHRFPDGQLHVNLRGHATDGAPTSLQALSLLLSALGVPAGGMPLTVDAAAGLYRSMIAGRRVLIVLDDAPAAAQVRLLLPGGTHSLTVVTSRVRLDGLVALDGAHRVALDTLTPAESVQLLDGVLRGHRAVTEDDSLAELAILCAHLPLALRIAAAQIAADPHRTVAGQVAALRYRDRLSALEIPGDADTAVRVAFDVSYAALPEGSRALFRLFGLTPGPDVTVDGLAALAGTLPTEITSSLAELVRNHLVHESAPGRYTLHDLLGIYAAERAATEDPSADRHAAPTRLLEYYLTTAAAACSLAYPQVFRHDQDIPPHPPLFRTAAHAVAWLDAERINLVAAARHALDHGPMAIAWRLADVLRGYFMTRRNDTDWFTIAEYAITAADATGEASGQAVAELNLGTACRCVGRYDDAIAHLSRAARASQQAGWPVGRAYALTSLGWTLHQTGHLQTGIRHLKQAITASRHAGSDDAEAAARNALAVLRRANGHVRETLPDFTDVLAMTSSTGSAAGQAVAHTNLGISHYQLGDHDLARRHLATALAAFRQIGDRYGGALVMMVLAEVHGHRHRHRLAEVLAAAALRLARQIGDQPSQAMALAVSAEIDRSRGQPQLALVSSAEAVALARAVANLEGQIHALIGLGTAQGDLGQTEPALANLAQALSLARHCGYRLYEGIALTALADVHLRIGDCAAAVEHAATALNIHRRTGYRFGAAQAQQIKTSAEATRPPVTIR